MNPSGKESRMAAIDRRTLIKAAALASLAQTAGGAQVPEGTSALSSEAPEISRWRRIFQQRNRAVTGLHLLAEKVTSFPPDSAHSEASDATFDDGSWDVTYSPSEYLVRISQSGGSMSMRVAPPVEEFSYTSKGDAEPRVQRGDMPPTQSPARFLESFLPVLSDEFASIERAAQATADDIVIVRQGFRRLWIDPGCQCIVKIEEFENPERVVALRTFEGHRRVGGGVPFPRSIEESVIGSEGQVLRTARLEVSEVVLRCDSVDTSERDVEEGR
jgi:hypothetical protein